MKPLRSHTEQKKPKIQPFLRFHYLLKFLILMSFRGASPPRAPQRALPWTRWGPWRSPDPSPIQGAPTNVNSWIRAWLAHTFSNNIFTIAVHMLVWCSSTGTNNVQMPKYSPSKHFSIGSGLGGTYIPAVSLICYIHLLYMYLLLLVCKLLHYSWINFMQMRLQVPWNIRIEVHLAPEDRLEATFRMCNSIL